MANLDLPSFDADLDALDPSGALAALGIGRAAAVDPAELETFFAELGAPLPSPSVRAVVTERANPAEDGSASLDGLFDDVAVAPTDERPISFSAPAASFLEPRESLPETSLEDLLEPPADASAASADDPHGDEPEIEIEEDEFAALDALEIDIDD